MKVTIKEIAKNRAYLFCAFTPAKVTKEMLDAFISKVSDYIQTQFPNRTYNFYEETHRDMLSIVAVLDVNDIKETATIEL